MKELRKIYGPRDSVQKCWGLITFIKDNRLGEWDVWKGLKQRGSTCCGRPGEVCHPRKLLLRWLDDVEENMRRIAVKRLRE